MPTALTAASPSRHCGGDAGGRVVLSAVLDIGPVPLCLEQRYAYYLAIPLGRWWAGRAMDAPGALLVAGLRYSQPRRSAMPGSAPITPVSNGHFWQGRRLHRRIGNLAAPATCCSGSTP